MILLKRIGIVLLVSLLLLSGCTDAPEASVPPEEEDLTALYLDAVSDMNQTTNYQLQITTKKSVTIGSETYEESLLQSVTIENYGGDDLKIATAETISIDSTSIQYSIISTNENSYIDIEGEKFSSQFSSLDLIDQYTPASLLNFGLYAHVDSQKTESGYRYTFADPYDIESWIGEETVQLNSASGSATLDADGKLTYGKYTASYTDGLKTVNSTTEVAITLENVSPIEAPEILEYKPIGSIFAPIYLEKACAYITSSNNIESHSTSQINSGAFDLQRQQYTMLSMAGAENDFSAEIVTTVTQSDSSGEITTTTQTQSCHSGTSTDSPESEHSGNIEITPEEFKEDLHSILMGNILTVAHIDEASITQFDEYILLSFTSTSDMTDAVCSNISQYLYGDNEFITSISDEVTPAAAECYLALNKRTGLPTASGILFNTQHKINETDHSISYRVDTGYYLGALQRGSDTVAAEPVTPMLYKVSDKDGSHLWILAATQYGDERTNNLAKPILDALTASSVVLTDFSLDRQTPNAGSNDADRDDTDPRLLEDTIFSLTVTGNLNDTSHTLTPEQCLHLVTDHFVEQQYRMSRSLNLYHTILGYAKPTQKKIDALLQDRTSSENLLDLSSADQLEIFSPLLENKSIVEEQEFLKYQALITGDIATLTPTEVSIDTCQDIANALQSYFGADDTAFAVIDVQYLLGDNGVLSQLHSNGYSVTQVQ